MGAIRIHSPRRKMTRMMKYVFFTICILLTGCDRVPKTTFDAVLRDNYVKYDKIKKLEERISIVEENNRLLEIKMNRLLEEKAASRQKRFKATVHEGVPDAADDGERRGDTDAENDRDPPSRTRPDSVDDGLAVRVFLRGNKGTGHAPCRRQCVFQSRP